MMENAKKYAVVAVFGLMIFGLAIAHWLLPDREFSDTERRALAQNPTYSSEALFDGSYAAQLETYLLEQFPLRDSFRGMKTVTNLHLWKLRETNDSYDQNPTDGSWSKKSGYYYADGHLMQLDETLDETQVNFAIKRFNSLLKQHPEIANAYYAIIPDKNYFLAEKNGYNALDYDVLSALMETVKAEKIDVMSALSIDDYYVTDSHWRQERLQKVVETLCEAMDVTPAPKESYQATTLEGFSGVYADHMAYPMSEELVYLQSEATRNAVVRRFDETAFAWATMPMYDAADFDGVDPYDIYLSGAETLITIENPNATSDKHLVLFRDSFASSLAPLLVDSYAKITMVDLRYISSMAVGNFVDFEDADVLFLYSTTLLNTAGEAFRK